MKVRELPIGYNSLVLVWHYETVTDGGETFEDAIDLTNKVTKFEVVKRKFGNMKVISTTPRDYYGEPVIDIEVE